MAQPIEKYFASPDGSIVTVYYVDATGNIVGNPVSYTKVSAQARITALEQQKVSPQATIDAMNAQIADINTNIIPLFK